ncbi:MAG: D-proline reductase (dithiol) proprotein PrdA, partial [Acidaminobacteraceae bacterium]
MSITLETAKEHAKDPAVVCCRFEAGTVIETSNLEDPNIFPDLEDSGLLKIPSDVLTIEEVLGAKLTKTIDALTPLTAEFLEGVKKAITPVIETETIETVAKTPATNVVTEINNASGVLKIHIGEGKDINLEIPMGAFAQANTATTATNQAQVAQT